MISLYTIIWMHITCWTSRLWLFGSNICLFSQVDHNTDLWLEIAFHIQVILSYLKLVGIYSSNKNVIKYQVLLIFPMEYPILICIDSALSIGLSASIIDINMVHISCKKIQMKTFRSIPIPTLQELWLIEKSLQANVFLFSIVLHPTK